MGRKIKFDYREYESEIKALIYRKTQRNPDGMATFSLHEINPMLHIDTDDIPKFERWLINNDIVIKFAHRGTDLFECIASDAFLQKELMRRVFDKENSK